jgi:ribosomal protein S18 acetylase RimI-like enzyme
MAVSLKEVADTKELRQYIYLPQQLHKSSASWVPPIYAEEWKFHDPKHNPALAYSDVVRLVAYANGEPVGRIMGIINGRYNEQRQEKTARFFNLDCVEDPAVSHALLGFIERWTREKGMDRLIGPFGFSDKDPQGLQIEGFDQLAVIAAPSNPRYLQTLVEKEGYTKEVDCVSYKLPVPQQFPAFYEKVYRRVIRNHKLELMEFKSKRQIKPYIVPALRLVNETYAPLFGFVPMSEPEMKRLANQYMPIIDPAFMKLARNAEGEMVGFVVALPDMSRGIQKAKGRLFPFGYLHMLAAARKTRQLDIVLGAIKQEYRGIGVDVLLAKALLETARDRGFEFADSHLVLETNTRMRAEYENLGGEIYKRYRVFRKDL